MIRLLSYPSLVLAATTVALTVPHSDMKVVLNSKTGLQTHLSVECAVLLWISYLERTSFDYFNGTAFSDSVLLPVSEITLCQKGPSRPEKARTSFITRRWRLDPSRPNCPFTRAKGPAVKASTLKTRQAHNARVTQVVDTNLSSYDRTDPFMAFNVLLKILGSLPSRIGGCQFKLTPEEHKLSLHLLNIVEPFVGLAPSRRTITRQPTEILDSIAFHVDAKKDLLSLALSCQRMHDIVFPRHMQYRHIRCKVSSLSVWNHLMVHRSLARNVRRLEILDERAASTELLIPGDILNSDTDMDSTDDELGMHEKQERFLVGALGEDD
ncbi:hypothetical protein MVEN_02638300 [Mycena venus]|uniref:F-box domain-containing protein n=1 Tax=Mycena venus TaxID=2733690 RepID=A0A8H6WS89_9AGAR|nr:hypothetical protein MVEN_02638300 [Mycena venus]